mmetsp:Transcript_26343/g.63450  ORF Transcript_26343/g.63450 Transcript_26343/m.63450 type:complete len:215 (-) Transcript_26343:168-812(-)
MSGISRVPRCCPCCCLTWATLWGIRTRRRFGGEVPVPSRSRRSHSCIAGRRSRGPTGRRSRRRVASTIGGERRPQGTWTLCTKSRRLSCSGVRIFAPRRARPSIGCPKPPEDPIPEACSSTLLCSSAEGPLSKRMPHTCSWCRGVGRKRAMLGPSLLSKFVWRRPVPFCERLSGMSWETARPLRRGPAAAAAGGRSFPRFPVGSGGGCGTQQWG